MCVNAQTTHFRRKTIGAAMDGPQKVGMPTGSSASPR